MKAGQQGLNDRNEGKKMKDKTKKQEQKIKITVKDVVIFDSNNRRMTTSEQCATQTQCTHTHAHAHRRANSTLTECFYTEIS